ncbi:hypothetical protein JCM21900_005150 [Sporobolomyces salmonicolor]
MSRFIKMLEVNRVRGEGASYLANSDLLPVPPEHRLWKAWNFGTFWIADSFNINTFMIASSMVGAGLTWWQAWLCVWVGYAIAGIFLVLNAIPGARYHVIFPAYCRASFGVLGALWPTLNRSVMACVWYGVQAWIGGEATYTLLLAIFPSLAHLHNGIPSSGTDTAHFLTFFLFSLLSLIVIWFPIHTLRHFFTLKAVLAPIGGITLFAWCLGKANGAGSLMTAPSTIHGSELGWTFVAQLMGCLGNMATLIVNAVDFASRAEKRSDVVLPQLISLPVTFAITSLFGILIGSSTEIIFGEFVWSPLDVMTKFLTAEGGASHATRAGVAIISICFIVAQIGTNLAANSLSAGCDLTAIFPRFITIRRGGYIAAMIGFCMCPWNLLASGANFSTYLSAYTVFLSSIAGVMTAHYWLVAGQKVKTDDLYTFSKSGAYRYFYGFNLRAFAAYLAGIAPNMPGFVGAVGRTVPLAATHIYELSWFVGFGISALIYYVLCRLFPLPSLTQEDVDTITLGPYANTSPAELEKRASSYSRSFDDGKPDVEEEKSLEGNTRVDMV